MANKLLNRLIIGGISGYLSKRLYSYFRKSGEEKGIGFIRRLLFKEVIPAVGSQAYAIRAEYDVVPKWLMYISTSWDKETTSLTDTFYSGNLIRIDGVFCLIYFQKEHNPTILVPKWQYSKIKDKLVKLCAPYRIEYDPPNYLYWDKTWMMRNTVIGDTLDRMPLHSEVYTTIRAHLDRCLLEWDMNSNMEFSRNLLLYGPKGSGKTTLVGSICHEIRSNLFVAPDVEKADYFLQSIYDVTPGSVLFFDEADELPTFTKEKIKFKPGDVSKRLMLDVFSGIGSPRGVLMIACTNNPDNFDDRYNRKGRFKDRIYVGEVDDLGIRRWLKVAHDYTVPDDVTLRPMMCADIIDRMDELDDPAAFVEENKVTSELRPSFPTVQFTITDSSWGGFISRNKR